MEFSGQEYWSGLPFPSPGIPPNPGIKPGSPSSPAGSSLLSHQGSPRRSHFVIIFFPLSQYISFWVCPYDYIKVVQSQPECCRWWCVLPQGTTAGDTYSSLSPCSLALLTPSSIIASFSFFLLAPNKQSVRKHFGPGQISCSLSTFSCQNWHWLVFLAWPTLYSGNSKSAAVLPAAPPH